MFPEGLVEALEHAQVQLQALCEHPRSGEAQRQRVAKWDADLRSVQSVVCDAWQPLQAKWGALRLQLFGDSDGLRTKFGAEDQGRFDALADELTDFTSKAKDRAAATNGALPVVVAATSWYGEQLGKMLGRMELCEQAMDSMKSTARRLYGRLYFLSDNELLTLIATGSSPQTCTRLLTYIFNAVKRLHFRCEKCTRIAVMISHVLVVDFPLCPCQPRVAACACSNGSEGDALGMVSREGEFVRFHRPFVCDGEAIEWRSSGAREGREASLPPSLPPMLPWVPRLEEWIREALRAEQAAAFESFVATPLSEWLLEHSAQMTLLVMEIVHTALVERCLADDGHGEETWRKLAGRRKECLAYLDELGAAVRHQLKRHERQSLVQACVVLFAQRDQVSGLEDVRAESRDCFEWQLCLRYV